jgi:predicted DNA-binding protein
MSAISLRIPDELEHRLEQESRHAGVPRSEIARTAIEAYLDRVERDRFLTGFIAEARATYGDSTNRMEALELAEEALLTDNEVLDQAEARVAGHPAGGGRRRNAKP